MTGIMDTMEQPIFDQLQRINARPTPFSHHTADALWTDPHISKRMLTFHLDDTVDRSSRTKAFIDESVAWMVTTFAVGDGTRIADLGCGPGLYTNTLARAGALVTGVDFSERSIRHAEGAAEKQGVEVSYIHGDYLELESDETFDLITMIMCDLCALGPEQRNKLLGKIVDLLRPGGYFLFDVCSTSGFEAREEIATYGPNLMDGFWSPRPYFGFLNTFKYENEKITLDKYEIVERERSATYYNWLQHFEPTTLAVELERAGLEIHEILGDVAGSRFDPTATEFAIIARHDSM
jgi:SAM-dependent methyltransferase